MTTKLTFSRSRKLTRKCRLMGVFSTARAISPHGAGLYTHTEQRLRWGNDSHGFLGSILFLKPTYRIRRCRCARSTRPLPSRRGDCGGGTRPEHSGSSPRIFLGPKSSGSRKCAPWAVSAPATPDADDPARRSQRMAAMERHGILPRIVGTRFQGPAPATFPVARPFLPLDRIMSEAGSGIAVTVCDGPGIRMASDHRPLRGVDPLEQPSGPPEGQHAGEYAVPPDDGMVKCRADMEQDQANQRKAHVKVDGLGGLGKVSERGQ